MDEFKCKICNKLYSSYKSIWNHNKKYHNIVYTQNIPIISSYLDNNIPNISSSKGDNNTCIKCKKQLSSYKNKWRHEQKCNKIDENKTLKNKNIEIKQMLTNILKLCKIHPKTLQKINNQLINNNINNNTINNGTINNGTINIVKFGSEDINKILSKSEILNILNKKMCSLEESLDNNKLKKFIFI